MHFESFGRWIGLDGNFWDALLTSIIVNSQVNQWIYCLSFRGYYTQTEILNELIFAEAYEKRSMNGRSRRH